MKKVVRMFIRVAYPVFVYELLLVFAAVIGARIDGTEGLQNGLIYTGGGALMTLLLFMPVYRFEHKNAVRPAPGDYVLLGCSGVGLSLAANLIIAWIGFSSDAYRQAEAVLSAPHIRLQILLIGFLVPAAEELIFRGICYRRLREEMDFWTAAVLSSLLFGWFHGNIVQGVYAFLGGILMAWGYQRFRSLKAAYCIHTSSNLLSLLISSGSVSRFLGSHPVVQAGLMAAGICLLLLGVIRIGKTDMKGKVVNQL